VSGDGDDSDDDDDDVMFDGMRIHVYEAVKRNSRSQWPRGLGCGP
jgi:hypothetical protein